MVITQIDKSVASRMASIALGTDQYMARIDCMRYFVQSYHFSLDRLVRIRDFMRGGTPEASVYGEVGRYKKNYRTVQRVTGFGRD